MSLSKATFERKLSSVSLA